MIKRSRADLDLAALCGIAVRRQHQSNQLNFLRLQRLLIAFREISSLRGQLAHHFIFFKPGLFHPRQLRQHLQVAPIAHRKRNLRLRAICGPRPFIQFHKALPSRHQPLVIHLKSPRQNLGLVFSGQLLGIFEYQRKPWLLKIATRIFFQLLPQRRNHIKCRVKSRKLLQHFHHSKIIFRRMQPRPRQHIPLGFRIAILRLMHVPQHHQVHSIHLLHRSCLNSSRVLHSPFATCAYWTVTLSAKFFATRSSDSSSSPLSSSFLNWFGSWSFSSATPAPAPKFLNFSSAFFRPSSPLPFLWPYLSACCSDLAACPPTAKSSLLRPSASAGAASPFPWASWLSPA